MQLGLGFKLVNDTGKGRIFVADKIDIPGFKYDKPILVYVPISTIMIKKVVLYLHGFRGICDRDSDSAEKMFSTFGFDFIGTLNRSDLAFVMPISHGHCDDFNLELAHEPDQLLLFLVKLLGAQLQIILAGHSGAYLPMSNLLLRSSALRNTIQSIILLDAMYSSKPEIQSPFQFTLRQNQTARLYATFIEDSQTDRNSRELVHGCPAGRAFAVESTTNAHCSVPNVMFPKLLKLSLA